MKALFALALVVLAVVACQKKEPTQTAAAPPPAVSVDATQTIVTAAPAEKTYTMNGKVVSRDAAKNQVTIDSEEVPGGVMAPMVMAYELRGANVDSLPPDGTKISSTLHEENGKYWVTDVRPAP